MRFIDKFTFLKGKQKRKIVSSEGVKDTVVKDRPSAEVSIPKEKKPHVYEAPLTGNQILVKPLVTEKASSLGSLNKYVFAVHPKVNKVEIKKEIKKMYNVNPQHVNIVTMRGRLVRYGRTTGTTKKWKKAIITLKPGQSIEVYKGV